LSASPTTRSPVSHLLFLEFGHFATCAPHAGRNIQCTPQNRSLRPLNRVVSASESSIEPSPESAITGHEVIFVLAGGGGGGGR
jgi:hypothetical protein